MFIVTEYAALRTTSHLLYKFVIFVVACRRRPLWQTFIHGQGGTSELREITFNS